MGTGSKAAAAAGLAAAGLAAVAARDVTQRRHAILRTYPIIGHLRFFLERFGPELRQYIVTNNDEERPFSRDQRRWIYASAKLENSYFGFGTDNDVEHANGYPIIKHRTFKGEGAPTARHAGDDVHLPSAKVLGGPRGRRHAFRPNSVVNISGMSFGSLSKNAIEALNRGAELAGCLHDTGEGALSPYHRKGGDLVFQIGTSYFGCRDEHGAFDLGRLKDLCAGAPVKAIEIKLSQGAKPGLGGMLPGAKVTQEIAEIRGIQAGVDCASPSRHTAFHDVDSMLDFVELLATETGLPVGIKSAVGSMGFWDDLVREMGSHTRGVDFVNVDGGEGGTGAAPLLFSDAVSYPFRIGFAQVYRKFAEAGLTDDVTFMGAGKLGIPENAVVAFALGVDMVNVAREAMMAIGCIQAQKCHTDHCPTGVATQNPWLVRGLDPELKSVRAANYVKSMRRDLWKVSEAMGVVHPGLITPDDVDILDGLSEHRTLREVYGYDAAWSGLGPQLTKEITEIMSAEERAEHSPTKDDTNLARAADAHESGRRPTM
ncbi:FMN-binding glutamate synthase family protein [Nocardioides agariphilus]|jgi:glutamate synthase (ferredoxin)|uniref:FMN-binding glutamate synthase family protein n=1 Tax=Nocardioides agariphilus TaxID=433664 RepID=A0A930YRB8_9ACTN|nr:FMN-binding glutamate synthase family protein [Nocardioides agariphilus]MBF4770415.1 FMN-binding glutamate synthase family protein [Nocardioides agariphilus]